LLSGTVIGGFAEKTWKKMEVIYPISVKKYYFLPFAALKKIVFFSKKNIFCKINKLKTTGGE